MQQSDWARWVNVLHNQQEIISITITVNFTFLHNYPFYFSVIYPQKQAANIGLPYDILIIILVLSYFFSPSFSVKLKLQANATM